MKSNIRLDSARLSSKQATKFAIIIGKSMFSSAMFDFERMRSLSTTQIVRMTSAFSTVHTNADLYAFSFVSTFESALVWTGPKPFS